MPYGEDPTTPPRAAGYGNDPTSPPTGAVAGQAERDRGIAHRPEPEGIGQAFRRGLSEGWGDQPPGEAFFSKTPALERVIAQPFQTAIRGVGALTHGAQEALSSTGQLGRDIAALPEAFMGSPGSLRTAVAPGTAASRLREATAPSAGAAEKEIQDLYTRAVKPSVSGKQTAPQLERYQERTRDAISSVVANKQNLRFVDEAGAVRAGELPKSLEEFGEAIDQTKQSIFKQYNDMAEQTGAKGVEVSTQPIVNELQTVANDPVARALHPELIAYSEGLSERLAQMPEISAVNAQRAIQSLNSSLKAFYRNPDYALAQRANIDAMVVNKLREGLDQAVESGVGPGYQELKNQYGALKAIEGDVVKRTQVVGRQEKGGGILGRIADVASAEEVLRGLITLSPSAVARGAAMKGWAQYVKYRRDPNRAITKLFEKAEEQQTPQPPRQLPLASFPVSQAVPAIPFLSGRQTPDQTMREAARGLPQQP